MNYLKTLAAVALAAASVLAIADALGVAGASSPSAEAVEVGTEIKASLVSGTKSKLTTFYGNVECAKSTFGAKVTGVGKQTSTAVAALDFAECNCEVKVLSRGTLEFQQIGDADNASVKSTGTEVTTLCSTVGGNVHCIYATDGTRLGTLEGGSPATIKISGAAIPHLATDQRCDEGAKWNAEYEMTSPVAP